jgi:hypothetical protein
LAIADTQHQGNTNHHTDSQRINPDFGIGIKMEIDSNEIPDQVIPENHFAWLQPGKIRKDKNHINQNRKIIETSGIQHKKCHFQYLTR